MPAKDIQELEAMIRNRADVISLREMFMEDGYIAVVNGEPRPVTDIGAEALASFHRKTSPKDLGWLQSIIDNWTYTGE